MGVLQKEESTAKRSISIADATTILQSLTGRYIPTVEHISLKDSMGRILAEDIYPRQDDPKVDLSTTKGFVLNTDDIVNNSFIVDGLVEQGSEVRMLTRPKGMRIQSGAPIPISANIVIPEEHCMVLLKNKASGAETVLIQNKLMSSNGIRMRAAYFRNSDCVLKKGTRIDLASMTILTCAGLKEVPVYKSVNISIGYNDDDKDSMHQKNGLTFFLNKIFAKLRVNIVFKEYVIQEKSEIKRFITKASQTSDIILTIGGITYGYEGVFIPVLNEWEYVKLNFQHVSSTPGKVFSCASTKNNVPILCLPGSLLACSVTFLWFVIPFIAACQRSNNANNISYTVSSPQNLEAESRTRFLFARSDVTMDGFSVEILPEQSSTALRNLIDAEGLLIVPADQAVQRGYPLQYFPFSDITKNIFC